MGYVYNAIMTIKIIECRCDRKKEDTPLHEIESFCAGLPACGVNCYNYGVKVCAPLAGNQTFCVIRCACSKAWVSQMIKLSR